MAERASDRWVSVILSVLLHGTLVAALVYGVWNFHKSRPPMPTLAIEGTVVDSRVLQRAMQEPPRPEPPPPPPAQPEPQVSEPPQPAAPTAEELAQREREAAEKQQAEQQSKQQEAERQAQAERAQREAEEKAEREAQEKAQREAEEKAAAERMALEQKKREAEQRLAAQQREQDEKDRAEREAELRNSLAAEEHSNAVRSSGALVTWLSQITARIQHAWLRPPSARAGIQCVLHITQDPGGAVVSARIESCNGDQAVRESIEAAAYRASPLPPPPDPSLFERDLEVTFRPD